MADVMNGPDSFSKCVTIGSSDKFLEVFSRNFPLVVIFGFFAFWIEENIDSWILFSFEFTANANRFLVPTRLLTRLKLFCLIF